MNKEKLDELFEQVEADLAYFIDSELYQPVREEIRSKALQKNVTITHTLGMRKERLKGEIYEKFEKLKKEIMK